MSNSPDLTMAAVKMMVSLAVVLAVIWGLFRVARKRLPMAPGHRNGKSMRILESQYLGVKKSVTMVHVPGSILVLGVSPDKVNMLARIDDPEIIKELTAAPDPQRTVLGFKEQLQRLTGVRSGSVTTHLKTTSTE